MLGGSMTMLINSYVFTGAGGGGPVPFTGLRSSNMTATSGTSATIPLPAGAQVGDELWLFRECTNANNATPEFTAHVALTGTFCNGRVEYKALDAVDIAAGSIAITMVSGAGAGVVWAVCLKGVPTSKVTTSSTDFHRDGGGGGSTRSITTVESAAVGDFAMIFGAQRDSSATAPTPSIGSVDQTKTGAPAASGYLITSIGSAGTLSCTWTYHTSISNGSFNGIVIVRA